MSSASSLDRKPIVAKDSVMKPASGPKPKIATMMMATMISLRARETATMALQTM